MIVERIWTGNAYRNYNYLIACPESGEALAQRGTQAEFGSNANDNRCFHGTFS